MSVGVAYLGMSLGRRLFQYPPYPYATWPSLISQCWIHLAANSVAVETESQGWETAALAPADPRRPSLLRLILLRLAYLIQHLLIGGLRKMADIARDLLAEVKWNQRDPEDRENGISLCRVARNVVTSRTIESHVFVGFQSFGSLYSAKSKTRLLLERAR